MVIIAENKKADEMCTFQIKCGVILWSLVNGSG